MKSTQRVSRLIIGGARIALIVGAVLAGCGFLQVRLASAEVQLLDDGAQQNTTPGQCHGATLRGGHDTVNSRRGRQGDGSGLLAWRR